MYQFTKNRSLLTTLAVVGLAALMTGCTTYSYTSRSTTVRPNEISSRSLGAEINVDFSKRVTASSEAQVLKSEAINEAQYKCINENNIDVIVDPIYKVEFNMFQKKAYKATVVGYAGTYKQVPTGVDAVVEKNYKVEDIEKYKLITDPSFYKYYYQKDPVAGGDVTNYYINSNGGTPVVTKEKPASIMFQKPAKQEAPKKVKPVKTFEYNKSKQLRDAGIGMFSVGLALSVVGSTLTPIYGHGGDGLAVGIASLTVGGAMLVSGIPMWAVGQHRMKKASDPQIAIGGTKDGLGMRLTF